MSWNELQRIQHLLEVRQYKKAKEVAQEYIQANHDDHRAYALMANCEMNLNNWDAAQTAISQSLALEPEYDYGFYVQTLIYSEKDQDKKALKSIQEALRISPEEPGYIDMEARLWYDLGNLRAAKKAVLRGLELNPNHTGLLEVKSLIQQNDFDEAGSLESLKKALETDPTNTDLLTSLGYRQMGQKEYEKSKETFLNALEHNPTSEHARQGLFEAQKASSGIFRIFQKYGFSQWGFKKISVGWMIVIVLFALKGVVLWGGFFTIFLLFTWYGDVLYNSVMRKSKTAKYLLSAKKIKQSNYFLLTNGLGFVLILVAELSGLVVFGKLAVLVFMLLFMGIAYLEVEVKRKRKSIIIGAAICLVLPLLFFNLNIGFFIFANVLILAIFGALYSFRMIG